MKFTYFRKTGEIYRQGIDGAEWDGDEGYDFDYEVEDSKVESALTEIIFQDNFSDITGDKEEREKIRQGLKDFLSGLDLTDEIGDVYYDELKDYFESEAQESEE
jgi:hypothetical protein